MVLSLSDILTAQGSKGGGSSVRPLDHVTDLSKGSFKDYVSKSGNDDKGKSAVIDYVRKEVRKYGPVDAAVDSPVANAEYAPDESTNINQHAKFLLSQITENQANVPVASINNDNEIVTSSGHTISLGDILKVNSDEPVTELDLIQKIKGLSENLDSKTLEEIKLAVESILASRGQEVKKLNADTSLQNFKNSLPLTDDVEGQTLQNPVPSDNPQSLSNLNATTGVPTSISELAGRVIEQVKDEQSKPEVSAEDISSEQVVSLLNLDKSDKTDKKNVVKDGKVTIPDVLVNKDAGNVANNINIFSLKQAELAAGAEKKIVVPEVNVEAEISDIEGVDLGTELLTSKEKHDLDPSKISISRDLAKSFVDTLQGNQSGNHGSGAVSDPTLKLQATDTRANTQKPDLANKFTSPNEVIAQIKFGVSGLAAKGERTISIQLHPKELGSVDIHMKLGSDGKNTVTVIAEKTDTLNLLQKEASSLRQMLQDALKTESGNLNFSFQERGNGSFAGEDRGFAPNYANPYGALNGLGAAHGGVREYGYVATEGIDIRV